MFTIVAWTNAPRLAELAMVQPDCAGVIPFGPVSWYGVAIPRADSGFAGTMMSQLTLAAATAAVGVAVADAVVHGVAAAVAAVVAAVVAAAVAAAVGAAVVAAAVAAAVGAAVGVAAVGVATAPVGVGATVGVVAAAVAPAVAAAAAVPAAVLAADGVAQAATLALLLAPNTPPTLGISNAPPTPATTATAPMIATSRVRDSGSNLRSWLKILLLRYDTALPLWLCVSSRAITLALWVNHVLRNHDLSCRTAAQPGRLVSMPSDLSHVIPGQDQIAILFAESQADRSATAVILR
ncbi:MAG: hypothetical protein ACLPKI_16730 [Streptosporangiaceae bacterium]